MINNIILVSLSVNFRFSGRKSQRQQKLAKKTTHFTTQFCATHSTQLKPQLTQHYKSILP